ncbi:hypothetical protein HAX54_027389 [Datura stramonium]|uniref:Uncharacterized protein n=1 Tax=Datura stramonium TaxID=4076 RepID=A0ABS8S8S1_DATST|nr:hypothetical protein [Datura stramonium]
MLASWEPKVTSIEEAKQMSTMQMDELISNLQTYELKKIEKVVEEPKKERNVVLKDAQHDSESYDEEMMMFIRRFKKLFKKENSEKGESEIKVNPLKRDSSRDISSVENGPLDKVLFSLKGRTKKKLEKTAATGLKSFQEGHESYLSFKREKIESKNANKTFNVEISKLKETISVQKTENSKLMETISSLKAELITIKEEKTSSSEIIDNDQGSLEAEITSLKRDLCKEKKEKF